MKIITHLISWRTWSITTKLTVALLIAAILPLGISSFYNFGETVNVIENIESNNLELLADSTAYLIDQVIQDSQNLANQISKIEQINKQLISNNSKINLLNIYLTETVKRNTDHEYIAIVNTQGQIITSSSQSISNHNFKNAPFFQKALAGIPNNNFSITTLNIQEPGLFIATPIRNTLANNSNIPPNQIIGVVIIKLKNPRYWEFLDDIKFKDDAVFLIDQNDIIIHGHQRILYKSIYPLSPTPEEEQLYKQIYGVEKIEYLNLPQLTKAIILARTQKKSISYHETNENKQVALSTLNQIPWVVGVVQSRSEFLAPIISLAIQNIFTIILVVCASIYFTIVIAKSIAKPIQLLIESATALEAGSLKIENLQKAKQIEGDLGKLALVFTEMAIEVKAREDRLKQQVQELKIEIDQSKKEKEVAEITGSEYFQNLQAKAQQFRKRSKSSQKTDSNPQSHL